MKEKIEFRPIGEEFQLNGVTLKVVEVSHDGCAGCFFETKEGTGCLGHNEPNLGSCGTYYREDKKSIIFKNVTTNEPND